jgi:hypothetical protein
LLLVVGDDDGVCFLLQGFLHKSLFAEAISPGCSYRIASSISLSGASGCLYFFYYF